jgi:hypothetical protein
MKKSITILMFLTLFWVVLPQRIIAQSDAQIDFFNLVQSSPQNLFAPLFDVYEHIKLEETWGEINSRNLLLAPVKIGIVDSGMDASGVRHPEFRGINFGNTPPDAKTDSETQGHGTQIVGIIGANNISATSSLNYRPLHMNGILSGAKNLEYTMEMRKPRFIGTFFSVDAVSVFREISKLSKENVDIINLSHNTKFVPGIGLFFERAFSKNPNTLFVVAAGNTEFERIGISIQGINADNETPAKLGDDFSNVITVGATKLNDSRASFSNFGDAVGIAAPGEEIYTPAPQGQGDFGVPSADYERGFSGTSAAAPMVTGVAGLLKAIKPDLTPAQMKDILIRSADSLTTTDPSELTKTLGSGCVSGTPPTGFRGCRLNALRAVCDPMVGLNCTTSTTSPFVIHTNSFVIVDNNNVSRGEIKSNVFIRLGSNNVHQGNVTTNSLESFGTNTSIVGDVGYNSLVLDPSTSTPPIITGTITTPTPPPNVVLSDISPFPSAGTTTLIAISNDTTLPPGNHGNIFVTNGATLTLLDGVYNFDELFFLNVSTSLRFSSGSIVHVNGEFAVSTNVHILPTVVESSVRLPVIARGQIVFDVENTVSVDSLSLTGVVVQSDNVVTGNMRGGGIIILANNRINVPPPSSLRSLQSTQRTYPTSTTPPLDTLNWMETNIMTALQGHNVATTTRTQTAQGFQRARAVLE